MEFRYIPPAYRASSGVQQEWEQDFRLEVRSEDGEVVLRVNRAGLISLAKHLLTLAQSDVQPGCHLHYDEGRQLEDGSLGFVIEKVKD